MSTHRVSISDREGGGKHILIDGVDIADVVHALDLQVTGPFGGEITLTLTDAAVEASFGEAAVKLSARTRALLIALGWTAPPEPESTVKPMWTRAHP